LRKHLEEGDIPDVTVVLDDSRLDAHDPERRVVEGRLAVDGLPLVHLIAGRRVAEGSKDETAIPVFRAAHRMQGSLESRPFVGAAPLVGSSLAGSTPGFFLGFSERFG